MLLISVSLPVAHALSCGSTITTSTTLTGNITCTTDTPGLIIGASGIKLNCAGFTITNTLGPFNPFTNPSGSHQAGVQVTNVNHVTVEKCHVTGFAVGIGLAASSSDHIKGNIAFGNALGIAIQGPASSNTLVSNTANSNKNDGFFIRCGLSGCLAEPSAGNTVKFNTADSNGVLPFGGYGYEDQTPPGSNTYAKDECSSNFSGGSLPTGLCSPQP